MELFGVMFELSAWTGWRREQGLLLVPLTTCFTEKLLNELMVPLVKASAVSTSPVYTTMTEVSGPRRRALGGGTVSLPCEGWTEYTTALRLSLSSKKRRKVGSCWCRTCKAWVWYLEIRGKMDTYQSSNSCPHSSGKKNNKKKKNGEKETNLYSFLSIISKSLWMLPFWGNRKGQSAAEHSVNRWMRESSAD